MNAKIKAGYKEAIVSLIGNCVLFVLKYIVGMLSGSIALIADGWHSLSDSFSSLILLLGFRISSKPADDDHPYGHGRAELIASVIIGTVLCVIGVNIITNSIERFFSAESADYVPAAIWILIISLLVKEILARYALHLGKKHDSTLLKSDGWHHRSDALSSLILLVSIIFGSHIWWLDNLMGLMFAGLLFYAAYKVLSSAIDQLMGKPADDKLIEQIHNLICTYAVDNLHIHHIHLHQYGDHRELTFHIDLPSDLKLVDAHDIAHNLENCIERKLGYYTTIHIDPL